MASSVNQVVSIDDGDEELIEFILHINRPKTFHTRINHLNKWDDTDFFRRFWMEALKAN